MYDPFTKEKTCITLCLHCGNKNEMRRVAFYEKEYPEYIETDTFGSRVCIGKYIKTWELYFCPACDNVTLILDEWDNFDIPRNSNTQLYPSSFELSGVPEKIATAFEAAVKSRHVDGAVCAMALRRTLEMICKAHEETEGWLHHKLKRLSERGVIPPGLYDLAEILKKVGNEAAHGDDIEFPDQIINLLIEFTRNILVYLYVLPHKLNCIQKEIENRDMSFLD